MSAFHKYGPCLLLGCSFAAAISGHPLGFVLWGSAAMLWQQTSSHEQGYVQGWDDAVNHPNYPDAPRSAP